MPVSDPIVLTAAQARVLGALGGKGVTTPEYYPLSLNALINACNQRSNREPVMNLDEDDVRQALHRSGRQGAGGPRALGRRPRDQVRALAGRGFNFSRAEDGAGLRAAAARAADPRRAARAHRADAPL